ncbi:hypothetical protein TrRE_jg9645 [Triparma retinervis]|uniref:t-SNARE coiled-coil homology domain-containing protein n=1 Tax=Triparma retinervis TaxID=2557542 RepID=A0A9W7A923_9STRA|nr:hypothetical protein TrRE_jg9645 [Triparma retinervis]
MALCCSNDSSYLDADLDRCLSSLRELQDSLKAETHRHAAPMLEEGGDMFNNLKSQIVGRLCTVRTLLENGVDNGAGGGKSPATPVDPQTSIRLQSAIRENVRQLNEEFRDLENCYKSESSRRRRKYSPAEAAGRRQLVSQLAEEIAAVKTLQKRQYMASYRDPSSQVKSMEDAELFSHAQGQSDWNDDFLQSSDVNASQKQSLLTIKQREAAFESTIKSIGAGVLDLHDLAVRQNEEVKMQNMMLEDMATRMEGVSGKMENINRKMKVTLRNVARGGDKLCVDIVCVVLALGLAGVAWREFKLKEYI